MDKVVLIAAFCGVMMSFAAAQNLQVVGDEFGWTVPQPPFSYSSWVSGKTFMVGDTLVFNFPTNEHDVLRVPQASYDACTQDNAIGSVSTVGPTNITLHEAGDYRFICTIGRHCQGGQKLAIMVQASTPGGVSPRANPSTPPRNSNPPPTDACAPTPSTNPYSAPPEAGSASASAAAGLLFAMVSGGVALLLAGMI